MLSLIYRRPRATLVLLALSVSLVLGAVIGPLAAATTEMEQQPPNSITVQKFDDVNADGNRQDAESYILDWPVYLYTYDNFTPSDTFIAQGTTVPGGFTFTDLEPGLYLICEDEGTGWFNTRPGSGGVTTDGRICTSRRLFEGNDLYVELGGTQFTGSIEIIHEAFPDQGDIYTFTGDFGPFDLNDPGNRVVTFETLQAGEYVVNAPDRAGWEREISCSTGRDGGATVAGGQMTFDLDPGEYLWCYVAYSRTTATLTIEVETNPLDATTVFDFVGDLGAFEVPANEGVTFEGLDPTLSLNVISDTPEGWVLDAADCDYAGLFELRDPDGTLVGLEISPPSLKNATCTFSMREETINLGELEMTKLLDWNGFPPGDTPPFRLCVIGPSSPTGELCQDIVPGEESPALFRDLVPGVYEVIEVGAGDMWSLSGMTSETIRAGQVSRVTVFNTHAAYIPLTVSAPCPVGRIEVRNPNAYPIEFTWQAPFSGESGERIVGPGAVQLLNVNAAAFVEIYINGVLQTGINARDEDACVGGVRVTKVVDWDGNPVDPSASFEVCITGPGILPEAPICHIFGPNGGTWEYFGLEVGNGSHLVEETYPGPDWTVTNRSFGFFAENGTYAETTITNTRNAPTTGSIDVTKVVDAPGLPAGSGESFTLCILNDAWDEPQCDWVGQEGGTVTFDGLAPGDYYVYEIDPGRWWEASGARTVTVTPGQSQAVTLTNRLLTIAPLVFEPICPAGVIQVTNPNPFDVPFTVGQDRVAPAGRSMTFITPAGSTTFANWPFGGSATVTALTEDDCGDVSPEPALTCPAGYTPLADFGGTLVLPPHPDANPEDGYTLSLDAESDLAIVATAAGGHPEAGCLIGGGNDAGDPCDQGQDHESYRVLVNGALVGTVVDPGEDVWGYPVVTGRVYDVPAGDHALSFAHIGMGEGPQSVTYRALVCAASDVVPPAPEMTPEPGPESTPEPGG